MHSAQKLNKEILTKDNFRQKYILQKEGWWQSLFGTKNTNVQNNNSEIIPDYDIETKITSQSNYLIHDNGGRPFKVTVTRTHFSVYTQTNSDSLTNSYDKVVIKPTKYKRIFVGRCPNGHGNKFDGNSILVHVSGRTYIFIGWRIYKLSIKDAIVGYKSPVFGSDVAYPYAYGQKNTYLLLEATYIPNDMLKDKDPYNQFYGHNLKVSNKQKSVLSQEHKHKYSFTTKLIHDRRW
jgi:hypothetical protein